MLKKLLVVAGFAMAMAFSTGVAHADTITGTTTGPSCPDCPAATYTLTVTGTPAQLASGTGLTVTLTINFTGAPTPGVDDLISAVAFKIGSSVTSIGSMGLSTTNTIMYTGFADSQINSGISNAGCSGSGGGFVCSSGSVNVVNGSTLTWTWTDVNLGGPVSTDPSDWSIKVDYDPHNGYLISDSPTGVPEPATVVLLGAGLIPLLGIGRRFLA